MDLYGVETDVAQRHLDLRLLLICDVRIGANRVQDVSRLAHTLASQHEVHDLAALRLRQLDERGLPH